MHVADLARQGNLTQALQLLEHIRSEMKNMKNTSAVARVELLAENNTLVPPVNAVTNTDFFKSQTITAAQSPSSFNFQEVKNNLEVPPVSLPVAPSLAVRGSGPLNFTELKSQLEVSFDNLNHILDFVNKKPIDNLKTLKMLVAKDTKVLPRNPFCAHSDGDGGRCEFCESRKTDAVNKVFVSSLTENEVNLRLLRDELREKCQQIDLILKTEILAKKERHNGWAQTDESFKRVRGKATVGVQVQSKSH